jgi:phosphodiesterase/alkaline phosphatase D-like protein
MFAVSNAEVPQIWQWDDHEVVNNWSASKDLSADARYTEKNVPLLIARGSRAFLEYAPMRYAGVEESERVYRHIPYGQLLDVFVIDMRSYRAANSFNQQTMPPRLVHSACTSEPDSACGAQNRREHVTKVRRLSIITWLCAWSRTSTNQPV